MAGMFGTPLHRFETADTTIQYVTDQRGTVGLVLYPTALEERLAEKRLTLEGDAAIDAIPGAHATPANSVDPLVHVKLVGDAYAGGFSQGRTLRSSSSNLRFRLDRQDAAADHVRTHLVSDDGLRIEHVLAWNEGAPGALSVSTRFTNGSSEPVALELLTSFSFGGITPFDVADGGGRLRVHRFRSGWSAEGRLESVGLAELQLERSWGGGALFSERFGQVGSMPVRGWFPFVALEDTEAHVVWGAQIAWAGSWQLEVARQHDDVTLSGGLADRELGHWIKTVAPGEELVSPPATIACVAGSLADCCDRLVSAQVAAADAHPAVEADLPIVFNEWCTTWGSPTHDGVVAIADRLQGTPVRYLVIDAGWYKPDGGSWNNAHGDWVPNAAQFPDGLGATAAAVRERGLVPGLWFEMETVGQASASYGDVEHLLHRDGVPIGSAVRRFWDLTDPAVHEVLAERVIGTLRDAGFGYIKVDYNETIGLGSDDADSLGEGLRRHVLGVHSFFERMRDELPDLVIESCSSGGHRLEPSMLARSAMSPSATPTRPSTSRSSPPTCTCSCCRASRRSGRCCTRTTVPTACSTASPRRSSGACACRAGSPSSPTSSGRSCAPRWTSTCAPRPASSTAAAVASATSVRAGGGRRDGRASCAGRRKAPPRSSWCTPSAVVPTSSR
jgi:alpha-galactosidase